MTVIVLPLTDDRDRLGHALYDALTVAGLTDLAAPCCSAVRAWRDLARGMEEVRKLTQDAEITFDFQVRV